MKSTAPWSLLYYICLRDLFLFAFIFRSIKPKIQQYIAAIYCYLFYLAFLRDLFMQSIIFYPVNLHYRRMLLTRHYDQRPFDKTVFDALIANDGVKKPSKKVQNVCDDRCIKHSSDFSCVCDAGHTVQSNEPVCDEAEQKNGQPDEGVCDIQHIVYSDELFVIRQHKRNGQPDQGVC